MEAVFRREHPWALLPFKARIDKKVVEEDAAMYAENYRWVRRTRIPEMCWPWRLAQEIGWIVPSPVDIRMTPFTDAEVEVPEQERGFFSKATGLTDFWSRGKGTMLVNERPAWLKLHEVKVNGRWQNMFFPLGNGFVEWDLGWEVELPTDYHLFMFPTADLPELEVEAGVLSGKNALEPGSEKFGMSPAVRPKSPITISRRQPIARIVILHGDSLRAKAIFEDCPPEPNA